jgi:hypothetical protein
MFAGFLVAYRFRGGVALLLAIPLLVAGVYCKLQYVAGPLAIFLFLLWEKRYRLAFQFAGLLSFCGLALFALFEWIVFHGQAFWQHFLLSQVSLLSWHRFGYGLFILTFVLFLPLLFSIEHLRPVISWFQ